MAPSGARGCHSSLDQACLYAVVGSFRLIHAKAQDRSSRLWPLATSWCRHGGRDDEGGASTPPCPDAAGAGSNRPASGRRTGPRRDEQRRSLLEIRQEGRRGGKEGGKRRKAT